MQSGYRALGNLGYYGEQLFDFRPFEAVRGEVLELGRACVHEHYRNTHVLHLLWKGIAKYASTCSARFLIGCSSLSSQDEKTPMALYETLREKSLVEPSLRTAPVPGHSARQTVCRSRRLTFPGCSVLTSRFPRACAVHRPLTGNSRRSTSLPSSICSGSPNAFDHDFYEQPLLSHPRSSGCNTNRVEALKAGSPISWIGYSSTSRATTIWSVGPSEPASRVQYAILDSFSAPAVAARYTANRKSQVQKVALGTKL